MAGTNRFLGKGIVEFGQGMAWISNFKASHRRVWTEHPGKLAVSNIFQEISPGPSTKASQGESVLLVAYGRHKPLLGDRNRRDWTRNGLEIQLFSYASEITLPRHPGKLAVLNIFQDISPGPSTKASQGESVLLVACGRHKPLLGDRNRRVWTRNGLDIQFQSIA